MGHYVQGFIAKEEVLRAAATALKNAHVVTLKHGFGLLLNTDKFFDELSMVQSTNEDWIINDSLWKFASQLEAFALAVSHKSPIAYFETDYWGGAGSQAAVVWLNGAKVYGPMKSDSSPVSESDPVNSALRLIGVVREPEQIDEFDTVGLGRFRNNENWINQPVFRHDKVDEPQNLLARIKNSIYKLLGVPDGKA